MVVMLTGVGFFHLAVDHAHPIDALTAQLKGQDPGESLIVLPEAFNLGRPYSKAGEPAFSRDQIIEAPIADREMLGLRVRCWSIGTGPSRREAA